MYITAGDLAEKAIFFRGTGGNIWMPFHILSCYTCSASAEAPRSVFLTSALFLAMPFKILMNFQRNRLSEKNVFFSCGMTSKKGKFDVS